MPGRNGMGPNGRGATKEGRGAGRCGGGGRGMGGRGMGPCGGGGRGMGRAAIRTPSTGVGAKVAVSSQGASLDAEMDPRFGRCAYFLIVDTDDMTFEAMDNSSAALGGGAGIQAARAVAEKGVRAVLTGNCGPNAHQTLTAAGIEVFAGLGGTIRSAVERFKAGELRAASEPNAESHAGMR